MFFEKDIFPLPFKLWIKQDKENIIFLTISIFAILIQFFVFKNIYPFPNLLPDSYSYLEAAKLNLDISIWPIGYSKFLRFLSVFNYTGTGLFFSQFLSLQINIIFFLLSLRFLLNPGLWVFRILAAFLILNPLWLYVSDFVSSDSLFAGLSLLWLTTLFWIIYEPKRSLFLFHGIVLFLVFSVRYNALYYPVFSLGVIFFSKIRIRERLYAILLVFIPLSLFIGFTVLNYSKQTETKQFSPFSGWQLASNAMFMYSHVAPRSPERVPISLRRLHNLTIQHMDSLNHTKWIYRPDRDLGPYYLWDKNAPLKSFLKNYYSNDSTTLYLRRWATVAPIFGKYGYWLIKQYPVEFIKFYLWPNLINYYSPSPEFLASFNMGKDTIEIEAIDWFKLKSNKVISTYRNKEITLTAIFPMLLAVINVVFLTGTIGLIFLGAHKELNYIQKKVIFLLLSVWIFNLIFSVIASPIVLRYQVFPLIFTSASASIFIAFLIKKRFFNYKNSNLN